MKSIFLFLFIGFSSVVFAVEDTTLVKLESKLVSLLDNLRAAQSDNEKETANAAFKETMELALKQKNAFTYPFTKLKTVGIIDSPDKLLRIVNWNVEQADNTHKYFCFLMRFDERKKEVVLSELIDNSAFMPMPQKEDILEADQWYGALYYKIIPMEKGSKTIYTLLGWDGATSASNFKLIDVLYFTGTQAKLGSPIFKMNGSTDKRVFFEHSEKATMSLRYEEEYNRIIFDHLSPESPGLEGFYSFYVPDLSLDALILEGNKWIFKEDVIGINPPDPNEKVTVYAMDEKDGHIEKKEIKNKWVDPSDDKAPAGGIDHKAALPEGATTTSSKSTKKPKEKKIKDKRDPGAMGATYGGMKKKKRLKN